MSEAVTVGSQVTSCLSKAIAAGHAAIALTGNVFDYFTLGQEIGYQPEAIADHLHESGYVVIRYSKSQGGRIHRYASLAPKDKEAIDARLNAVGLLQVLNRERNSPDEMRTFFRGVSRLLQVPRGENIPVAVVLYYGEHLAPAVQTAAAASDEHTFVTETLHMLANAPALRKSGNVLVCVLREGYQNVLLDDLYRVEVPYPDEAEVKRFLDVVLERADSNGRPRYGPLDPELSRQDLARLTRGLRLRDVEAMLRDARAAQVPLRRERVLHAKADAILRASEGTLAVTSSQLTVDDIVGLEVVKRFFDAVAAKLRAGDPTSPRSILMAGPPGTSKSSFAPILATMCGFNILQFNNVKNMYVGESERRLNLALRLVEHLAPTVLFIDEITETTPSRNASVNDGGVSLDLLAQLFRFSARDELRGKVLLLAATNVPERLDPAWHDRFIIIPFLELLPDEIVYLFPVFERRLTGQTTLRSTDPYLTEASQLLHKKGASPRRVLDVLDHALLFSTSSELRAEDVLRAAHQYTGAANPMAVAYCSLVSISLTSFRSYLPWSLDPKNYVYPWYLEGLVDRETGDLDREQLAKRIQEYRRCTDL